MKTPQLESGFPFALALRMLKDGKQDDVALLAFYDLLREYDCEAFFYEGVKREVGKIATNEFAIKNMIICEGKGIVLPECEGVLKIMYCFSGIYLPYNKILYWSEFGMVDGFNLPYFSCQCLPFKAVKK